MQQFRADLHIHSRHSRATSKALGLRLLAAWARVKGLGVLATGDFTHPGWQEEIEEHLEPDGSGLYRLKNQKNLTREIPWLDGYPLPGNVRFMLSAEISSIYKSGGRTRKIHNLVYVPDLDAARRLSAKLSQVGNLASDGRPILGLPARDLLEMVLGLGQGAFLAPAHIWTPWFSLFGSKSGFDSVEECFGDLSGEIFAMETGLSSDPAMNWMWSALDRFRMISNSDAHSGEKLGREANLFSGERSFAGIRAALKGEGLGNEFLGTLEFFPEEGKYHLDGHRDCSVVLEPEETRARGGLCPACGRPLTVGVLSRVLELADRSAPQQPPGRPGFVSLIPLAEVLGEVLGQGPNTKGVKAFYARLVTRFGSELDVLQHTPPEDLAKVSRPLAEALSRMRRGEVYKDPGFDGRFGVISLFTPKERKEMAAGKGLVELAETRSRRPQAAPAPAGTLLPAAGRKAPDRERQDYNPAQRTALTAGPGPVLVLAGPGTGKTHTLVGRAQALMERGVPARHILAVTFTRRAAEELRRRLMDLCGAAAALPRADTLHALAFECWVQSWGEAPVVLDEDAARRLFGEANPGLAGPRLKRAWTELALARERQEPLGEDLKDLAHAYAKHKESWNLADYTDLLVFWLEQIQAGIWANPYTQVLVDEVQDLTPLQLALVSALAPEGGQGLFAIGDPHQSIYSFRGAVAGRAEAMAQAWAEPTRVTLAENFRSSQAVLDLAAALLPAAPKLAAKADAPADIRLFAAPGAGHEASWIAERVRELLGATSHSLADAGDAGESLAPGDIAVLVRARSLVRPILHSLSRAGVPAGAPETEAFWSDSRAAAILDAAGRFLGLAGGDESAPVQIPSKVVGQGPRGLAAYLQDIAPFDRLFWQGPVFRQLRKSFEEHGGWAGLLNWVHLQTEADLVRAKAEKVQVMTLHAAKGLEFSAVFLPALEDGILPFAGAGFLAGQAGDDLGLSDAALAEERRLLYVGLTRARRRLFLSHAARRDMYGRELRLAPSRFLADLPEAFMTRTRLVGHTVSTARQLDLLG
ncbi:MAG: UvrD-helicase domain-containing protein [Thermodesulfobacteriota bacterium]